MSPGKNSKIESIIWDIGDVLLNLNFPKAHNHFIHLAGTDPETYNKMTALKKENIEAFEKGEISEIRFYQNFCSSLQINISLEKFRSVWNSIFEVNTKNIAIMERCLELGLFSLALSNTNPIHLNYITQEFPFLKDLDSIVASYEVGFLKPDPLIYKHAMEKSGLNPGNTLFVDDREENIEAAGELGLRTFHYSFNDNNFFKFMKKNILNFG